jgi:hypothetical protein
MRPASPIDTGDEQENLVLKAWAALIAAPVFELSLLLGLFLLLGRRAVYVFLFSIPLWLHVAYMAVAAVIGLVFGFRGLTWLLGHLFLTHRKQDQKPGVTVALWMLYAAVLGVTYMVWKR